jgi:hypothetical protein
MGNIIVSAGAATVFPATGSNATVASILDDIAAYIGGQSSPHALGRARIALKQAVREFNTWAWRFNRMQQTISWVANTTDYALNSDIRDPYRATLMNASSIAISPVEYREYSAFSREFASRLGTSSYPTHYTVRNVHETGLVTIYPPMGSSPSTNYPSMLLDYHRRIALPTSDDGTLDVPLEAEEALRQTAVAIAIAMSRTFEEATVARNLADRLRFSLEAEWRDWVDTRTYA